MNANCQAARGMYDRTKAEKFALGAFNVDNQETLIAVARAAAAKKAPVLVEVSHDETIMLGMTNIRCLVDNYRTEYGIQMFINLDHSPSVEAAKAGIDAGFEFIHIDISQSNHDATVDDIIAATKEVVEYAKTTGALVESEPHYFGGGSNDFTTAIDENEIKKWFTKPEEAVKFVAATQIDTYAAAIGNLHGNYPVPKHLHLDLLQQIRDVLPCAISLHGGSDTPLEQFQEAAKIGVSKININSDLRHAYRTTLEAQLKANPHQSAIIKLLGPVIDAVQAVVETKIDAFGSAGRAQSE